MRRNLFLLRTLLWLTVVSVGAFPIAVAAAADPIAQESAAQEPASKEAAAKHEGGEASHGGEAGHEAGWGPTIAKTLNFLALAGVIGYFLKTPFVGYLNGRSEAIRKDLVDAASLRTTAEQQLAAVRERLAQLPAEVASLQQRGRDELAQERVRLAEATTRERDRVLERTRREIDTQFRVARRALIEHAAELSMNLARTKIERNITADDQSRLIDRYAAEVRP